MPGWRASRCTYSGQNWRMTQPIHTTAAAPPPMPHFGLRFAVCLASALHIQAAPATLPGRMENSSAWVTERRSVQRSSPGMTVHGISWQLQHEPPFLNAFLMHGRAPKQ